MGGRTEVGIDYAQCSGGGGARRRGGGGMVAMAEGSGWVGTLQRPPAMMGAEFGTGFGHGGLCRNRRAERGGVGGVGCNCLLRFSIHAATGRFLTCQL